MSREPSSAAHRYNQALGKSGAIDPQPATEPVDKPKAGPPKRFKVTVVPAKKKPIPKVRTSSRREAVLTKALTSMERLSVDERALLREHREITEISRRKRS